jgi:hypothetical protein
MVVVERIKLIRNYQKKLRAYQSRLQNESNGKNIEEIEKLGAQNFVRK